MTLILGVCIAGLQQQLMAQVPQGINYQAVARNNASAPIPNASINVRFTITDATAAELYKETHTVTTSPMGLFNAVIGGGSVVTGIFSVIPWLSGPHYLKVELDPDGNGYQLLGTTPFQSVPYALVAGTAANSGSLWTASGNDIYYNTGIVGIGTATPNNQTKLHVDNGKVLFGASGGQLPARLTLNAESAEELVRGRLNGISVFSIEGNGDFGIGTVSPQGRLDIRFGSSSLLMVDTNGRIGMGTFTPTGKLHVDVGGTPALFVNNSSGWVGMGTSAPGVNLDVAFNTSATSNGIRINLEGTGDAVIRFALSGSTKYTIGVDQSDNEYLKIGRGLGVSSNPIMTLKVDDVDFADDISADYVNANRVVMPAGGRVDIGSVYLMWGGTKILRTDCDIVPAVQNTDDLGSSGFRFNQIYLVNSPNVSSDARLKKDIRDLDYGLAEVMKLRPVRYKWKDNPDQNDRIGLIAQELQPVIGEVVSSRQHTYPNPESIAKEWIDTPTLGVTYEELIPVLIKAIQEQQDRILELQERLTVLENRSKE
ncbi:MAG TPA: tail fiber domain-containing protein [Bacteroidales bacterium]|nr:tail fiber domain-containing protein [Bacteroidales bacterium]